MKKQLTVTIDKDVIDQISLLVESKKFRSVSHALEYYAFMGLKKDTAENTVER